MANIVLGACLVMSGLAVEAGSTGITLLMRGRILRQTTL